MKKPGHKILIIAGVAGAGLLLFIYLRKKGEQPSAVAEPLNAGGVGMGEAGSAANQQNTERERFQAEAQEKKAVENTKAMLRVDIRQNAEAQAMGEVRMEIGIAGSIVTGMATAGCACMGR